MHTYYKINIASGRGKCRDCQKKIPKDTKQLVATDFVGFQHRYDKNCGAEILKKVAEVALEVFYKLTGEEMSVHS